MTESFEIAITERAHVHIEGLHKELAQALGPTFAGLSASMPPNRSEPAFGLRFHFTGDQPGPDAVKALEVKIQAVVNAHRPVWIETDKAQIQADGFDAATITIHAPRNSDTVLVLQCFGPGETKVVQPVKVEGGKGKATFRTKYHGQYRIVALDEIVITAIPASIPDANHNPFS